MYRWPFIEVPPVRKVSRATRMREAPRIAVALGDSASPPRSEFDLAIVTYDEYLMAAVEDPLARDCLPSSARSFSPDFAAYLSRYARGVVLGAHDEFVSPLEGQMWDTGLQGGSEAWLQRCRLGSMHAGGSDDQCGAEDKDSTPPWPVHTLVFDSFAKCGYCDAPNTSSFPLRPGSDFVPTRCMLQDAFDPLSLHVTSVMLQADIPLVVGLNFSPRTTTLFLHIMCQHSYPRDPPDDGTLTLASVLPDWIERVVMLFERRTELRAVHESDLDEARAQHC
jgi:hypothetical protein